MIVVRRISHILKNRYYKNLNPDAMCKLQFCLVSFLSSGFVLFFLQVLSVRIVNVIVLLMVVVSKHCD